MIYVQLDNENVVVGLSQLAGEVSAANMVQVENFDVDLLGRVYDKQKGVFGEKVLPQSSDPAPSSMEILTAKVDYISMVVEGLVI